MIVIRLFMPLSIMLHLAAAAPGLFMPLSSMLQVQIWIQLPVLVLLLKAILVITGTSGLWRS